MRQFVVAVSVTTPPVRAQQKTNQRACVAAQLTFTKLTQVERVSLNSSVKAQDNNFEKHTLFYGLSCAVQNRDLAQNRTAMAKL